MNRGALWATFHGATNSWTWLRDSLSLKIYYLWIWIISMGYLHKTTWVHIWVAGNCSLTTLTHREDQCVLLKSPGPTQEGIHWSRRWNLATVCLHSCDHRHMEEFVSLGHTTARVPKNARVTATNRGKGDCILNPGYSLGHCLVLPLPVLFVSGPLQQPQLNKCKVTEV